MRPKSKQMPYPPHVRHVNQIHPSPRLLQAYNIDEESSPQLGHVRSAKRGAALPKERPRSRTSSGRGLSGDRMHVRGTRTTRLGRKPKGKGFKLA